MEFVLLYDLQADGPCHEYVVVATFAGTIASTVGHNLVVNHFVNSLVVAFNVGLVAYVGGEVADGFVLTLEIGVEAWF